MTLTDFLLARIAEDEAVARNVPGDGEFCTWNRSWDMSPTRDLVVDGERVAPLPMSIDEHICRWDPARVLAECQAKRRIVEMYEARVEQDHLTVQAHATGLLLALRALAQPYADHPDFDPAWAV